MIYGLILSGILLFALGSLLTMRLIFTVLKEHTHLKKELLHIKNALNTAEKKAREQEKLSSTSLTREKSISGEKKTAQTQPPEKKKQRSAPDASESHLSQLFSVPSEDENKEINKPEAETGNSGARRETGVKSPPPIEKEKYLSSEEKPEKAFLEILDKDKK